MSESTVVKAMDDDQIVLASERANASYYRVGPRVMVKMRKNRSSLCLTCKAVKGCCHTRRLNEWIRDNVSAQ